jgi:hypothetical protein
MIIAALSYSWNARADDARVVQNETLEPDPLDWAVDVGVGLPIGAVGFGAPAALGGVPMLSATLERRLGDRLWAMVSGSGSYERAFAGANSRAWSLGGSAGLRHALTPPEPIEVSWYAALQGSYARMDLLDAAAAHSEAWSGGLKLGLALDKHFTEWFGLRLTLDAVQLGYQSATTSTALGMPQAQSWFARVSLSPSFGVRFSF